MRRADDWDEGRNTGRANFVGMFNLAIVGTETSSRGTQVELNTYRECTKLGNVLAVLCAVGQYSEAGKR